MALYGAMDRAVVESGNEPDLAATVERYLPGTTGVNAGWFAEIETFVDGLPGEQVPFPDVEGAVTDFYRRRAEIKNSAQKARMVYAIGALSHIGNMLSSNRQTFADALSTVAPPGTEDIGKGLRLNDLLAAEFTDGQSWARVADLAVQAELMDQEVANWVPCDSRLLMVGDQVCIEVNTQFERDSLPLYKVMNILEPENWPKICDFFCEMHPYTPDRPDGWTPVLETVSLTCPQKQLTTALKVFKSEVRTTAGDVIEIHVDYDLDEKPPVPGDGHVTYDRGYLNVVKLGENGVSVRTKKVVHIDSLSPVAQNQWVCISGYGSISMDMVLGGAKDPPKGATPWKASKVPTGSATGSASGSPSGSHPGKPTGEPVAAAFDLVTECAKDLAATTSEVARKWAAGTLTPSDMMTYSAYVGGRAARDPWRFLEMFSQPRPTKDHEDGTS
jgi:hypothetical protein